MNSLIETAKSILMDDMSPKPKHLNKLGVVKKRSSKEFTDNTLKSLLKALEPEIKRLERDYNSVGKRFGLKFKLLKPPHVRLPSIRWGQYYFIQWTIECITDSSFDAKIQITIKDELSTLAYYMLNALSPWKDGEVFIFRAKEEIQPEDFLKWIKKLNRTEIEKNLESVIKK